ncbi:MAG TPA: hypothetical protein VEX87_24185 [Skermanella sp.]|jgi:hypothetical protein|nr:hypothetical protein [Skermanella sp.]
MLTVLKILTLFLTMLTLAPGLAHLFELPNKIDLPRDAYFTVQGLYAGWAWSGVVIVAAVVANLALAWRLRRYNRKAAMFAAASAVLIAVSLIVFFNYTFPANQATANWTTIPEGWERLRTTWEYSHAVNALINTVAFLATAIATTATSPPSR